MTTHRIYNVRVESSTTTKTSPKKKHCRRLRKRNTHTSPTSSSSDIVVNMSSETLNKDELSLLSKGLNLCSKPPNYDRGNLINDTESYSRRMRLKCPFEKADQQFDNSTQQDTNNNSQDLPNDDNQSRRFENKSDWKPPKQTVALETFISNIESDIASFQPTKRSKDNLSKGEKQAIRSPKQRQNIIIKPADKGSAVVVKDKDHYVSEAERQLNDNNFYKHLVYDPTPDFQEKVRTTLKINKGD